MVSSSRRICVSSSMMSARGPLVLGMDRLKPRGDVSPSAMPDSISRGYGRGSGSSRRHSLDWSDQFQDRTALLPVPRGHATVGYLGETFDNAPAQAQAAR